MVEILFNTSVYAALEVDDKLFVGGSNWERRKVPYTKPIAEDSKGVLLVMKRRIMQSFHEFPSMVYSITELSDGNVFVGCKSKGGLNIVDRDGAVVKQSEDPGNGVYNSAVHGENIVTTCRDGLVEVVNRELEVVQSYKLTDARMWSLVVDGDNAFAGDYEGMLHKIDLDLRHVQSFDLKQLYERSEFGPSLWGLDIVNGYIVTGNRWGDINILNKDLKHLRRFSVGESISCLMEYNGKLMLGTRTGKLIEYSFDSEDLRELHHAPPALQKENAVWGMSKGQSFYACFADGEIYKLD